jgi:hypothetical protein
MRHRLRLEVRGPTVERLKFSARVAGHLSRAGYNRPPDWHKPISNPHCGIQVLIFFAGLLSLDMMFPLGLVERPAS